MKLLIAYDGSAFAGWQSQLHRNTIQDALEHAIFRISGKRVRLHGAGRTDAGVHALGQCAHLDLPDRRLPAKRWTKALNGTLPPTIRVLRSAYVPDDFHARYSAKAKTYRYRIRAAQILPPLELNRAWHVTAPLDTSLLNSAAQRFFGRHDFAAFAANRGKKECTVRTIRSVQVRGRSSNITIEVTGDGFLYKMVRLMVGAMVQVAIGKMPCAQIDKDLRLGRAHGARFSAPAEGLYLIKVWY
ncbi:MAG TPA: tRNA pseudouridine(38-40) synthase TruA [Chthoniobacterales bacterium]|nr:tRNA pseudouridine(38-40) synthase TruA [Chthoniobacterales bacterium]